MSTWILGDEVLPLAEFGSSMRVGGFSFGWRACRPTKNLYNGSGFRLYHWACAPGLGAPFKEPFGRI